jgi:hypothetical protein
MNKSQIILNRTFSCGLYNYNQSNCYLIGKIFNNANVNISIEILLEKFELLVNVNNIIMLQ